MKNLFLCLLIAALPCTAVFAQTDEIKLSPENEKKCLTMSREMANDLMLNEPEFIQLKALTRNRLAKEATAQQNLQHTPEQYASRMQEIEAEFEAKLHEFLTPSQKKAYAIHKQTLNADMIVITTEE